MSRRGIAETPGRHRGHGLDGKILASGGRIRWGLVVHTNRTGDTHGAGGVEYGARGSPLVRANIAATLCRRSSLPMAKITEGVSFNLGEAIGTLIRSQVQDLLRTSSSLIGGEIHLNQVVSDRVSGIFTS